MGIEQKLTNTAIITNPPQYCSYQKSNCVIQSAKQQTLSQNGTPKQNLKKTFNTNGVFSHDFKPISLGL